MIPNTKESLRLGTTMRKLWKYIKKYKLLLVSAAVVTVLGVICNLSVVYYIKIMVDRTLKGENVQIVQSIGSMAFILLAGMFCNYLMTELRGKIGAYVVRDLRKTAIKHIENVTITTMENSTSGDLVTRINDDASFINTIITNDLTNYMYFPLIIVGSGIYMAIMNIKLFLITFTLIPITLIVVNLLASSLNKKSKEYSDEQAKSNQAFFEMIGGIEDVKSYNAEDHMFIRYQTVLHRAFHIGMQCEKLRVINYSSIINIVRVMPYILCIVYGGKMVFDHEMNVSVIIAFTQLLDNMINPSVMMSQMMTNLRSMIGAIDRILEVMDYPVEDSEGVKIENFDAAPIEFDHVSFSYNNTDRILNDVSFKLEGNSSLTLVGASGCGKSTIMKLICGFYRTSQGRIYIYGTDINKLSMQELRKQIAFVSQDIYLFPDSIAQNIAYGKENVSMEQIVEAAKKADAHEFILQLEHGYETIVGEAGSKLSGGQRQRIAIARALIKDAPIILLDEPTSSLDFYSESVIQTALEALSEGRSVIKVTHRLNTIKSNEEIYVIDHGEVVQKGIHSNLVNEEGPYQSLYLNTTGEV